MWDVPGDEKLLQWVKLTDALTSKRKKSQHEVQGLFAANDRR